jgi:NAD(P)-dependent dehydrogenase (short-subunit alcohol dehydrogenase family)/acyl carrier protein
MFDALGETVLAVDGFRIRHAPRAVLEQSLRGDTPQLYEIGWAAGDQPPPPGRPTGQVHRIAIVAGDSRTDRLIAENLSALGHRAFMIERRELSGVTADLVVDGQLAVPREHATPGDALACALSLAGDLQAAPRHVPYAVLAAAGAHDGRDGTAPIRESLWGMLASLEAEQQDRRLLRVSLTAGWEGPTLARALLQSIDDAVPEGRLQVGTDGIRVGRLQPVAPVHPDQGRTDRWSADPASTRGPRAALITGGMGALGLSAAGILAAAGFTSLTLMGRSGPDAVARQVIEDLSARGVTVRVIIGDVNDLATCRRAVREAGTQVALRTVLHLAGTTADHAFENLSRESFEAVFGAKATGAMNLVTALEGLELDALVFFSSASSVLGAAGQANYAAANGYLDGLAHTLRAAGVPATSVNWGPWVPRSKGGLAASAQALRAIGRLGLRPLDDEEAGALLSLAIGSRRPRVLAMALDRARYVEQLDGHPRAALLRVSTDRQQRGVVRTATAPRAVGWLSRSLQELEPVLRDDHLRAVVREITGEILGEPGAVDDELGFSEMGLDSIMIIDLRTRLSQALDADLPATVALDHPSVAQVTAFALARLFPGEPAEEHQQIPVAAPSLESSMDIEIDNLTFDELIAAVKADLATKE